MILLLFTLVWWMIHILCIVCCLYRTLLTHHQMAPATGVKTSNRYWQLCRNLKIKKWYTFKNKGAPAHNSKVIQDIVRGKRMCAHRSALFVSAFKDRTFTSGSLSLVQHQPLDFRRVNWSVWCLIRQLGRHEVAEMDLHLVQQPWARIL